MAICVACVLLVVAGITAASEFSDAYNNLDGKKADAKTEAIIKGEEIISPERPSGPWALEALAGFAFLVPGIAMVKHRDA